MAKKSTKETPLMGQYNKIKAKYPDALLLFRVGDFYETFGEDAVRASKILGIILTARNNGSSKIELAGFPHHSLDTYLPKLVRAGERVAICDQLEDPKATKKIVKRGVTEVVTPGISFSDKVLNTKENNFLAAIFLSKKKNGAAFLDVSTGEFLVAEGSVEYIGKLLQGLKPSEVLCPKGQYNKLCEYFGYEYYTYKLEDWVFAKDYGREKLLKQFQTSTLKGFGVEELDLAQIAAGAILHYTDNSHHQDLGHITAISRIQEEEYVWLDRFTIRNLELVYSLNPDATTLIDILDDTQTSMGGRMMKRWLVLPLKDKHAIEQRLEVVEGLAANRTVLEEIREKLSKMGDMERMVSRAAVGKINPREVLHLMRTLEQITPIKETCSNLSKPLQSLAKELDVSKDIINLINTTLQEDAPLLLSKGEVIKEGVNKELDELRDIQKNGKAHLDKIIQRETEATGIASLKIGHNNVFGYYIEVRNAHKDKVPEGWIRKQTLTQAERYITEELKKYEATILGAEEKIAVLESKLYSELVIALSKEVNRIQKNATLLAKLDCLSAFAHVSLKNKYSKPALNDGKGLEIIDGRHPVIEQNLPPEEDYVPNSVHLDPEGLQIMMITGPNMSGKSAILRQTALIVLMAQIGCFVPATAAEIGIVDKIFTRVGASDNISSGESTFMVEMNETASILNNLSDRSLILLDEIGRGTSTYDGISIAWAITEYIHQHPTRAKTLFATHYHELNDMSKTFDRIKNYNVSVREVGKKVLFMRKLVEGGSAHSFGIHVAKMAGMPNEVIKRANQVLKNLESSHGTAQSKGKALKEGQDSEMQLSFFQLDDPVLGQIRDEIKNIDVNNLTPVEALMKLNEIKKLSGAD